MTRRTQREREASKLDPPATPTPTREEFERAVAKLANTAKAITRWTRLHVLPYGAGELQMLLEHLASDSAALLALWPAPAPAPATCDEDDEPTKTNCKGTRTVVSRWPTCTCCLTEYVPCPGCPACGGAR